VLTGELSSTGEGVRVAAGGVGLWHAARELGFLACTQQEQQQLCHAH